MRNALTIWPKFTTREWEDKMTEFKPQTDDATFQSFQL